MKKLIVLIAAIFLFGFSAVPTQKNEYNGVKKSVILLDGKDITSILSFEQQAITKNNFSNQIGSQKQGKKAQKKAERAQRKAEKAQRKTERAQRKVEKEIKAREKANKNYSNAKRKYKKDLSRYEKLKKSGKLSPQDEVKWKKRLKASQNKIEKYQRKL